jgi:hypothetical protein
MCPRRSSPVEGGLLIKAQALAELGEGDSEGGEGGLLSCSGAAALPSPMVLEEEEEEEGTRATPYWLLVSAAQEPM